MSTLVFRNVDAEPSDPIDTWPHEAFQAAIEHGLVPDWQRIVNHIDAHPFGAGAATLAEVLEYTEGVGAYLLRGRLSSARKRVVAAALETQHRELRELVAASTLTQKELARRIGTSETRLSTWLSGHKTPGPQVTARIRAAIADSNP